MNLVLRFLAERWQRLGLESLGSCSNLSTIVSIPSLRDRLTFLVFCDDCPEPVLFAKLARCPGDPSGFAREAQNLRYLEELPVIRSCVPRLVAFEKLENRFLLVETALAGGPVEEAVTRHNGISCLETVLNWVRHFHMSTISRAQPNGWIQHLADQATTRIVETIRPLTADAERVKLCGALLNSLSAMPLCSVFEHGDLGRTNVLILKDSRPGIVDWELSEPKGVPALDLFFFLAAIAFVRQRAAKTLEFLAAFRDAFFGSSAWARPYVLRYADALGIPAGALSGLFLLCWTRYLSNMLGILARENAGEQGLSAQEWFRSNVYTTLWEFTVDHFEELNVN